jgi:hypothetical protein
VSHNCNFIDLFDKVTSLDANSTPTVWLRFFLPKQNQSIMMTLAVDEVVENAGFAAATVSDDDNLEDVIVPLRD